LLSEWSGSPRGLHSFPTRRSSDLGEGKKRDAREAAGILDLAHEQQAKFLRGGVNRKRRRDEVNPKAEIRRTSEVRRPRLRRPKEDRKSTRLNSSHRTISYAVFCLK